MTSIHFNATDIDYLVATAEHELSGRFKEVDAIAEINQKRVLDSFRKNRLTEEFFAEKTGYGRNDPGREAIDRIFADVFEAQSAAVRMQFVSGTHAIGCALLGNVGPGEFVLSLTGEPYDTMKEVIGTEGDEPGSFISQGGRYVEIDLCEPAAAAGEFPRRLKNAVAAIMPQGRGLVYIQKSCGYSFARPTLSNEEIGRLIEAARAVNRECVVLVDNCYGEFVEAAEPTSVGADLIAGSLIKNPGGGLALTGGYVAGRSQFVDRALNRLTAPGVGGHQGLTFNQNRLLLQGLFMAPSVVSQALKGVMLVAAVFERLGLKVKPGSSDRRFDIIQAVEFGDPDRLVNFCRAVQRFSPVNAHVVPEPALMPGYQDEVVMAAGTFVEGATIELSADGPLREPFAAFLQGGLTYLHVKCMLQEALALSAGGELAFF